MLSTFATNKYSRKSKKHDHGQTPDHQMNIISTHTTSRPSFYNTKTNSKLQNTERKNNYRNRQKIAIRLRKAQFKNCIYLEHRKWQHKHYYKKNQ